MALHSLKNMLGKAGYVKIGKDIYLWGKIIETDASGLAGYIAILRADVPISKGQSRAVKTSIWGERGLIKKRPKKGLILGDDPGPDDIFEGNADYESHAFRITKR